SQLLPDDELDRLRIAIGLGFDDWSSFYAHLEAVRQRVRTHFSNLIADTKKENDVSVRDQAVSLWMSTETGPEALDDLRELGYRDVEEIWRLLSEMKSSKQVTHLQAVARERLDKLMPLIINACGQQDHPDLALQRVLRLIEAVRRRSAYMALLVENPRSLNRLALMFSASPWVADTMCRYPVLLDTLLNEANLLRPLTVDVLSNELRQLLLRIPEDDLERQMDCLRQFKHAHVLRVAASEMAGTLPLMKVSDYLTWLAETLLQAVFDLAWRSLVEKHGRPQRESGTPCDPDFIIVGYGKVGGLELSYSSDLDLVFIHDAHPALETDGSSPLDNNVFFARLGQRIIHILTTRMASGELYETDMRLRPSGNSGLLVSSLAAFERYQNNDAWTWEHQALVRARVLAGCPRLAKKFDAVRRAVLAKPRDPEALLKEVTDMRQKMLGQLSSHKSVLDLDESLLQADEVFDLKQDPGGIVDIEFLAQYLVLRHSGDRPAMAEWTDNMRILYAARDEGILTEHDATALQQAYLAFRSESHRLALLNAPAQVSGDHFVNERREVRAIWHKTLG
ncbi:MAG TPA: bifunctional [glutamate--ammonia ligase]-adenylyl-L-tyrosine phosphorylase/[glutamate--ammonia-ligase] adenylyltransferase, partial [Dongiaceae bacterium]|nr:bifunctional [glutamate--ammonia ligase]-adenylyl-L-tyrosine phosphorylase/[glutamate--ammonia-ligase] adenylyltransferase [Dongiaceae bacterium]